MRTMRFILSALFCVAVAACGGGGSGSVSGSGGDTPAATGTTISGGVMKGPVTGATVTLFSLNADGSNGAKLGTTTTNTNGAFVITLTIAPTTPILAEASGGTYVDEATGATVVLTATDKLTAAMPIGTTYVIVTPLTHIAAARALALAARGTPLATAVDSSNMGVAAQYGIADIIATNPPAANSSTSVALSSRDERIYALVLAGITQQAKSVGVRAIDLAKALAEDAKDGILDGKNGAIAINVTTISGASLPLPATAGTADIQTAINAFIASVNNKTSLTQVKVPLTPVNIGVNAASALYTNMPVLPYVRSGETITTKLTATGGTPPYTCNLKAGSLLPAGFALGPLCQLTGTAGIVTNDTIFAPFVITLTDSSTPPNTVDFPPLYLTALRPGPVLGIPLTPAVSAGDSFSVTATKGVGPYHFKLDTFLNGTPPLGTTVDLLTGKVTVPATTKAGTYNFGVCVVDVGGRSSCQTIAVTVSTPATTTAPTPTPATGSFSGSWNCTSSQCAAVMGAPSGTRTFTSLSACQAFFQGTTFGSSCHAI
jgi:hypothetical protein